MTDKIDKALNINSLPSIYRDSENNLTAYDPESLSEDTKQAREALYDALVKSQEVVEDMLSIARQSQHPKAYEVLNSTIKTLADISMNLMDLQVKQQKIAKSNDAGPATVNNNLFVGSTAELLKMLENKSNSDE